jgi:hypothetical protein
VFPASVIYDTDLTLALRLPHSAHNNIGSTCYTSPLRGFVERSTNSLLGAVHVAAFGTSRHFALAGAIASGPKRTSDRIL